MYTIALIKELPSNIDELIKQSYIRVNNNYNYQAHGMENIQFTIEHEYKNFSPNTNHYLYDVFLDDQKILINTCYITDSNNKKIIYSGFPIYIPDKNNSLSWIFDSDLYVQHAEFFKSLGATHFSNVIDITYDKSNDADTCLRQSKKYEFIKNIPREHNNHVINILYKLL